MLTNKIWTNSSYWNFFCIFLLQNFLSLEVLQNFHKINKLTLLLSLVRLRCLNSGIILIFFPYRKVNIKKNYTYYKEEIFQYKKMMMAPNRPSTAPYGSRRPPTAPVWPPIAHDGPRWPFYRPDGPRWPPMEKIKKFYEN
jgi:hypothetical protein